MRKIMVFVLIAMCEAPRNTDKTPPMTMSLYPVPYQLPQTEFTFPGEVHELDSDRMPNAETTEHVNKEKSAGRKRSAESSLNNEAKRPRPSTNPFMRGTAAGPGDRTVPSPPTPFPRLVNPELIKEITAVLGHHRTAILDYRDTKVEEASTDIKPLLEKLLFELL